MVPRYLNRVDGKIYEFISEDAGIVAFRREGRETLAYLGRAEFERRFLLMAGAGTLQHVAASQAAADVLAERLRQVSDEDFPLDEDDAYTSGELAWAATCYLQNAAVAAKMQGLGLLTASQSDERGKSLKTPETWPWDAQSWKPSGQRRDLVKAAALIIAEIERLDRAELSTSTERRDG